MKLRTIFILLCILILAGVGLFFYYQDNIFSEQLLNLTLSGNNSANTGEEITYTIAYQNNNNFILKNPKLIFELPDNSLTEDTKLRFVQDLEDIAPKEDGLLTFKGRLLGKEGDIKIARVRLSYIPENLSARYEASATQETKIQSTPINLTLNAPDSISVGKEATFIINYASDIDYPLENIAIKLQAPTSFRVSSSIPSSINNSEWKLPVLQKGKKGTVKINGTIIGEAQSTEKFSVKLGMWQNGSFIVVKETDQDVSIMASPLIIKQTINGSDNYTPTPGELLNYQITIKNNSNNYLDDYLIAARLSGRSFDITSLTSPMGQASGNTIMFDVQKNPTLASIAPGQEVIVNFNIKIKDNFIPTNSEIIKTKITVGDFNQDFINKIIAPEPG